MNHSTMFDPSRWAKSLTGICFLGAIAVVLTIASSRTSEAAPAPLTPVVPLTQPPLPKVQLELVQAERFQVEKPFRHLWRADQPLVNSGWLLVLSGDPARFVPRQVKEPVLYVGAQTAQRVNFPEQSGKLVVIVPGDFRLEDAPIFFGAEALPEELRQPQIDAELEAARAAGARPPTAEAIQKAMTTQWKTFASDYELRLRAIELVAQHSPQEQTLIRSVKDVPLLGR
ncbi:MAG TPA: hypothetical protein VFD82_12085 [Planctomycetota bacterium]|nr:hypothetical protein [Planctomycetota bacterium]